VNYIIPQPFNRWPPICPIKLGFEQRNSRTTPAPPGAAAIVQHRDLQLVAVAPRGPAKALPADATGQADHRARTSNLLDRLRTVLTPSQPSSSCQTVSTR
jgi:hypothetical protein